MPRDGVDFAKLTDFGIAKIVDAPAITFTEQRFGTPGYIAPEYIDGEPATALGDLYALGVVLYQMMTGSLPFDAKVPVELLALALEGKPVKPSSRVDGIPSDLEELVLRMIARKPEDRPRGAFAVHDALEGVLRRLTGESPASSERTEPSLAPVSLPVETAKGRPGLPDLAATVVDGPPPSVLPSPRSWLAAELAAHPMAEIADRWQKTLVDLERHIETAHRTKGDDRGVRRARELSEGARALLVSLEKARVNVAVHQAQVDALEVRGRAFRATLGHAIDALSRDHSREMAHLEAIAALRGGITEELEVLRTGDSRQVETLAWEKAAVEAEEARTRAVDADLTFQIMTLQRELEAQNGELEAELAEATGRLEGGLSAVRRMTGELVRTMADAANCL